MRGSGSLAKKLSEFAATTLWIAIINRKTTLGSVHSKASIVSFTDIDLIILPFPVNQHLLPHPTSSSSYRLASSPLNSEDGNQNAFRLLRILCGH
jgi:hypothetical protein